MPNDNINLDIERYLQDEQARLDQIRLREQAIIEQYADPAIPLMKLHLQIEKEKQERRRLRDAAMIESYQQGIPTSTSEAIAKSAGIGLVDYSLNVPLNFGGYVPFIGPKIQQAAEEFRKINDRESRQLADFKPPNFVAHGAIQAPQTISSLVQDVATPVPKVLRVPLQMVRRAPRAAAFIQKHGPDALATLYHAVRGSADNSLGGAISGSGYLVGEKVFEPAALKLVEKLLPRFEKRLEAAAAMGNVGGALYEKLAAEIADWYQKQDD